MYHNIISRKQNKNKEETIYNYHQYKRDILNITYKMLQDNSEQKFEHYHLYKDIFNHFSYELLNIQKNIEYSKKKQDISNNILEEDRIIIIKEKQKQKTITELFNR